MKAWMLMAAFGACCGCANGDFRSIALSEVVAKPHAFNGQLVTLCGWATNQFEDLNLTVDRAHRFSAGLAVEWCEDAPKTRGPTYACISGAVEPAWGMSADAADGKADIVGGKSGSLEKIVVSTASGFSWAIRQSCLHLHDAS